MVVDDVPRILDDSGLLDDSGGGRSVMVVVGLTVTLAALDIVQAVLAKEWSIRRDPWLMVAAVVASLALLAVFVYGIRYAEMTTLTIGWIVMLQVALMVTEQVRYGIAHPPGKWVATAAIVVLLAYLVVTPSTSPQQAR